MSDLLPNPDKNPVREKVNELQLRIDTIQEAVEGILDFIGVQAGESSKKETTEEEGIEVIDPFGGWREILDGRYYMPPTGWKNEDGVVISGMIPPSGVPAEILKRFQDRKEAEQKGEE